MTAQELRIGNLYYGSENTIGVVEEDDYMNWKVNGCRAKPIPLDEEWLLRFGFEMEEPHIWIFPENKSLRLWGFAWSVQQFSLNTHMDGWDDIITPSIKYAHQLQNLFFALTGEELKTKK